MAIDPEQRARALEIRAKILGEAWDRDSRTTPGLESFTEIGIDHIWAGSWLDPALELRLKSLSTISALIAIRQHPLLRFHVAGALREGLLSAEELRAIPAQLYPYVGYPVAREAMVIIDGVIADTGS